MRGQLILIEGLDRTGKSTQTEILTAKLALQHNSKLYKFPDRSTPIGQVINRYLTDASYELSDEAAHLLFSANRWEASLEIVRLLDDGWFVVMDRYVYSGLAYSLAKLVVGSTPTASRMGDVQWLYAPDRGLPKPDVTFFLTLDMDELANRKGWGEERYEKTEFQHAVKKCFLAVLEADTDATVAVVDVNGKDIGAVTALLWAEIARRGIDTATDKPLRRLE